MKIWQGKLSFLGPHYVSGTVLAGPLSTCSQFSPWPCDIQITVPVSYVSLRKV